MKMCGKVFLVLMVVCLVPMVLSKTKKVTKSQSNSLSKARCEIVCRERSPATKSKCKSQCRIENKKPGTCPISDTPKWEKACVETCTTDAQCDGTMRCCYHSCGSACNEPVDLLTIGGLPGLPLMGEPKEKKRSVVVQWSDGVGDLARAVPGPILYLLEVQQHLGPNYDEIKLGPWNQVLRTNRTKVSLRNALKPGRWYRFRVAAVNVFGTRGFSDPSPPFTLRRGPRPPPPPKKLKVRPLKGNNGTVTVMLEWKAPNSDLPVLRYKVFWSRRVKGLGGELDSVLVNHQTVPKDKTYAEIKDLLPNSMYFLQVQTISQFGTGKLRSEKASIFYNTTSDPLLDPVPAALRKDVRKIKGLVLQKIIWSNNKMKAQIAWQSIPKVYQNHGRYYVHWNAIKCNNPKNLRKEGLSAVTQLNTFDIYELDYDCRYKVIVNSTPRMKTFESELTVNVPSCEYLKKKVNSSAIVCEKL